MTKHVPEKNSVQFKQFIAAQPTLPITTVTPTPPMTPKKRALLLALVLTALFVTVLFVTWHTLSQTTPPTSTLSTATFTTLIPTSTTTLHTFTDTTGNIQAYIVGAVKHPGVYTLPTTARVYQLLQAAGGPLSNANLLSVNLAAKVSDGQEIYVSAIGETSPPSFANTPPNSTNSTLVNINTSTVADLRQNLHLSQTIAQNIVAYRSLHGNFTSTDQLLQAVSQTIYNKIKNQVTI